MQKDPSAPTERILAVDDDESVVMLLRMELEHAGFDVTTAMNGQEAVEKFQKEHFDFVITDMVMPEMSGVDVLEAVKKSDPDVEVVILTAHGSVETAIQGVKYGAYDYLIKPHGIDDLLPTVRRALERRRLILENRRLLANLKRDNEKLKQLNEEFQTKNRLLEEAYRKLREAQQQLIEREKQAAVIELAGAASHELNQHLAVISGIVELWIEEKTSESKDQDNLQLIFSETQKMADIVRKIGRITHYKTKPYIGDIQIIDLDAASKSDDNENRRDAEDAED